MLLWAESFRALFYFFFLEEKVWFYFIDLRAGQHCTHFFLFILLNSGRGISTDICMHDGK